jgi:hypothetical protein
MTWIPSPRQLHRLFAGDGVGPGVRIPLVLDPNRVMHAYAATHYAPGSSVGAATQLTVHEQQCVTAVPRKFHLRENVA